MQIRTPRLIVDAPERRHARWAALWQGDSAFVILGETANLRVHFLNILREIKYGITSWRPLWHLKVQRLDPRCGRNIYVDADFKEMQARMRHRQVVMNFERFVLANPPESDRQQQKRQRRHVGDRAFQL